MSLFDITNPVEKAKAAIAEAQKAKADQHAKGAIDAMNAAVQAAKLAEVQKAMDEATKAATAAAAEAAKWKQQEETIEDALEHAGISGVDVQIDGKGYAKLVGSVTSEADRDTAVAMVEQFAVTGMEVSSTSCRRPRPSPVRARSRVPPARSSTRSRPASRGGASPPAPTATAPCGRRSRPPTTTRA